MRGDPNRIHNQKATRLAKRPPSLRNWLLATPDKDKDPAAQSSVVPQRAKRPPSLRSWLLATGYWLLLPSPAATLLKLLPTPTRTRIIPPNLLLSHNRRSVLHPSVTGYWLLATGYFFFGENGRQPVKTKPLIQRKHHQIRLRLIEIRQGIDLPQHPSNPPARSLTRHRQRISEQGVIAERRQIAFPIEIRRDLFRV